MAARSAVPVEFLGWPPSCQPERCSVVDHAERLVRQPAAALWPHLVRAGGWPRWYANARRVRVESDLPVLQQGVTFHWRTFGTEISSTVDLFEPPHALGWSWQGSTASGYHVWLLQPQADDGRVTRVVTEETQRGPGPRLLHRQLRPALHLSHVVWLHGLERRARRGPPPVPQHRPRR